MPNKFVKKLSELMALPVDVMTGIPVFTLRGHEELEADGCTGILEYSSERVVLAMKQEKMTVTGEGLLLTDFRNMTLLVQGNIRSVAFGEAD